jgi:hypothetical protein
MNARIGAWAAVLSSTFGGMAAAPSSSQTLSAFAIG